MLKALFVSISVSLVSCAGNIQYDLIIKNALVLDVESGHRKDKQYILIKDGIIAGITTRPGEKAWNEIDAEGRLVTPGLIDTHIHPTDVFGDYDKAPLYLPADSVQQYRERLSSDYLPYGITTALMMGHPEAWLEDIIKWNKSDHRYTDFITCGPALISTEGRTPYIGHLTVADPLEAAEKVKEYHDKGLRHIKVYHRLREPEFSAVIRMADSLNMKVYGHIGDFDPARISITESIEKGLTHFEHIATFPYSLIRTKEEWSEFDKQFESVFGKANTIEKVVMMFLEAFRYIDENKNSEAKQLIRLLADHNCTFSTTIGFIHQQFSASPGSPLSASSLTQDQADRSRDNFGIMMGYLRDMSDAGIPLRIATDAPSGGSLFLNELQILTEHGFTTEHVFRIATINGAKAIGVEQKTGSIETGKSADLIIWENSPFENAEYFHSKKIIVKNGRELREI